MRRRGRMKGFSGCILLLIVIAGGWFGAKSAMSASRPMTLQQPVIVEIQPGLGAQGIADRLAASGVLRNRWPFLAWHYLRPSRATLKAGEYMFQGEVGFRDVYNKLARGDVYYHTLTVPEGFNLFDVADVVEQSGLAKAADFLKAAHNASLIADIAPDAKSLEGFLFPDTYRFTRRTTASQMVQTMVARFRQVWGPYARPDRDVLKTVTLASLVEKETGKPEERPLVAGVFKNRMVAGMPLQCDPTVVYAALLEGKYRGTIYASDLRRASPYNTYVSKGLPPGPVANPGKASLEAAVQPANTEYLYFVANSAGGHTFSKTLAEHNRNVSGYRRRTAAHVHG